METAQKEVRLNLTQLPAVVWNSLIIFLLHITIAKGSGHKFSQH